MKRFSGYLTCILILMVALVGCGNSNGQSGSGTTLRVASQGYAEVEIQAEIAKQLIEAHTDHKVEHIQNFGGGMASMQATRNGDLDMLIGFAGEYFLGTFEQEMTPEWRDQDKLWDYVHDRLEDEYGLYTFGSFGYNNVYAIAVPRETAEELKLKTTSDLAPYAADMVLATDQWFTEVSGQGYTELCETYGFSFGEVISLDLGLMYRALGTGEVDAAVVYTTDGRNIAGDLVVLEDDKSFNPPYYGMLVARAGMLDEYPEVKEALELQCGLVDTETQTMLNARVDVDEEEPDVVAREYLEEKGLL